MVNVNQAQTMMDLNIVQYHIIIGTFPIVKKHYILQFYNYSIQKMIDLFTKQKNLK